MAVTAGAMTLLEVRAQAAQALAPEIDGDPAVLMDTVDSLEPPALMLTYDDPWLEPQTMGACLWDCRLEVICVASRIEPGPGMAKLEELVAYVATRLRADPYSWPAAFVQAPRVFTIGKIPLLGTRMTYRIKVTL